ncbi:amidohydrolase [Colwelliaceae bacterium 6471]
MKNYTQLFIGLFITLSFPIIAHAQTTLIKNVKGYTLADDNLVEFVAIQFTDDKIDRLFVENEPLPQSNEFNVINGQGKTLIPGLIDAHGHVLSYGLSLLRADLVGTTSEQEAVKRVQNYAKNNKSLLWIQGQGWNQVQWDSNQFPSATSLDKYFPDTPVWLRRIDGHAGWANSKAMQLAGISKDTLSPAGGEIIKNASGEPNGVFIDNAMSLIDDAIAPLTLAEQKSTLVMAMTSLASMGLTSVHDAGISKLNINAYKELSKSNKMPIRVNAMLDITDENWRQILAQGKYKSDDDKFVLHSVKISADGALGSRGAALIEDYSDKPGHKGLLLHDQQSLANYMKTSMEAGFQVNTHAIGDNANNIVLNNYEQLIAQTNTKALRHRIEHAQILKLSDIPRFNHLKVIASMQATHATSDKNMAQARLGEERILGAYAWRKLINAKAIIAAGSDFPVESANPFYGLHASITRQDHQNQPQDGWFPQEKMTRIEAFKSFTIDAAYSGHQESIIGSLSTGKKADFVLLEDNIFTIAESKLWQNKVLATWVNGKKVYTDANTTL